MGGYGVSPRDYWELSADEVTLIIEANKPPFEMAGLSKYELDELVEMHESGDFI